ncbi:DUF4124 domain-containing protein [Pinirhizobacter sp.]|jgi:hypothetical protein|uniref:DUF4124 domain-containing protein n=1 Tax=Pinirhizobacter sp. TaxID=2950432 RepID=UPI002F41560C
MRLAGFVFLMVLGLLAYAPASHATDIYKCTTAKGEVTYQNMPCPHGAKSEKRVIDDTEPMTTPPAPLPPVAPAPPVAAPPAQFSTMPPPPPGIPVMYGCVRATDGTPYTSNGPGQPYQAPAGVVGSYGSSLSAQAAPSAPEINRVKVNGQMIGNNYVWVQDSCHQLSPEETCKALQDQLDENGDKLRKAFKSQQAPFEQRDAELRAQLKGCAA